MTVTPVLDYCPHGYCETEHCRACEIMGVCKLCVYQRTTEVIASKEWVVCPDCGRSYVANMRSAHLRLYCAAAS